MPPTSSSAAILLKGWEVEWMTVLPEVPGMPGEADFNRATYVSVQVSNRAKARARAHKEAKDPSRPVGVAYIRAFHMEERAYGRLVKVYDTIREEVAA